MPEEKPESGREMHRKLAVNLFNKVWDYLDKPERTAEENDFMIHAAHVSRHHWGEIGAPLEFKTLSGRGVGFTDAPHLIAKMPDHELWMAFFEDLDSNRLALMCELRQ